MSSGDMMGLYKNAPCILTCTRDSAITARTPEHGFGYSYWTIDKSIQDSSISIGSNYIYFNDGYRFVSVRIIIDGMVGCDGVGINIIDGRTPSYSYNFPIQDGRGVDDNLNLDSYVWNGICRGINHLNFTWTSGNASVGVDNVKIFVF